MNDGYSKTPLAKKLGLKNDFKIMLYNQPDHYFELFTDLPTNLNVLKNLKSILTIIGK